MEAYKYGVRFKGGTSSAETWMTGDSSLAYFVDGIMDEIKRNFIDRLDDMRSFEAITIKIEDQTNEPLEIFVQSGDLDADIR